ncbi:MAG: hypothetical protein LH679_01215 [Cyanobacteria bacterium CAN_BIN43]|nr:hypothetical protein [Cyanobacteria bacterium CAN_BIN43]
MVNSALAIKLAYHPTVAVSINLYQAVRESVKFSEFTEAGFNAVAGDRFNLLAF